MDENRARALIDAERARAEELLAETLAAGREERASDRDTIAESDGAQPLAEEWVDDAVAGQVRQRLEALDRASRRLANGTYGLSVLSGARIPGAPGGAPCRGTHHRGSPQQRALSGPAIGVTVI